MLTFNEKLTPTHLMEGRVPVLIEAAKTADSEKQSIEVVKKVLSLLIDELGGSINFSLGTYLSSRASRERAAFRPGFYDGAPEQNNLREAGVPSQRAKALPASGAEKDGPRGNQKGGRASASEPKKTPAACVQHKKLLGVAERLAQLFGRKFEEVTALLDLKEKAASGKIAGKSFAQQKKSLALAGKKK